MCEVFEEVKEEGIEIGKSEGIEIGKNEGIKIGAMNTRKQFLEKLLKNGFRNLDELVDYTELSTNMVLEVAHSKNIQLR